VEQEGVEPSSIRAINQSSTSLGYDFLIIQIIGTFYLCCRIIDPIITLSD